MLHEDRLSSCLSIVGLLSVEQSVHLQALMIRDLASKSSGLPPTLQAQVGAAFLVGMSQVPSDRMRVKDMAKSALDEFKSRKHFDVAIVVVTEPELRAAKITFGIALDQKEDDYLNGYRYFFTTIKPVHSDEELTVVLTMVGQSGNVECAVACDKLFHAYSVGTCILCGIAAGLKGHVKLGDVVAADLVIDYESGRSEADGFKKRPKPYPLNPRIARDLNHFSPDTSGWREDYVLRYAELTRYNKSLPSELTNDVAALNYHKSVIVAGEKLLADDSLKERREEYHDRVRAGEMEGSGFARVCEEHEKLWLMFRGISDYGDPDKHKEDLYQTARALAATTAAAAFLRTEFRVDRGYNGA